MFKYSVDPVKYQKCPVCEGRGTLPHNFYSRAQVSATCLDVGCKTCDGKGIIDIFLLVACKKDYEAQNCNHVKESQTSASDYLCTICGEKYKPEKQAAGLVPLSKKSLMNFLQNTVDGEDANLIKEGIWDGEYLADEIISKYGTSSPKVLSVEDIDLIVFRQVVINDYKTQGLGIKIAKAIHSKLNEE